MPFYIRAGKLLPVTCTEIVARLRQPALDSVRDPRPNYLRFRISPAAEIAFGLNVMDPEETGVGQTAELMASRHPEANERDAYERVLSDALAATGRSLPARTTWRRHGASSIRCSSAATAVHDLRARHLGPRSSRGGLAAGRLAGPDRERRPE